MTRPLETAQAFHGRDGMGDIGLPLAGRTPASGDAVAVLRDLIRRAPGEIELVALAPLTNIAAAFRAEPGLATQIKRLVIMGGAGDGIGNITPLAEYNLWVDPEAAQIVFASGAPIEMVGWDIARHFATFDSAAADALRSCGAMGAFFAGTQRTLVDVSVAAGRGASFNLPDPAAMAVALDPSIVTASERAYVEIETGADDTRGQAIVDRAGASGHRANVTVIDAISRERFIAMLHAAATVPPAIGS
jgi:purine nucleosidase